MKRFFLFNIIFFVIFNFAFSQNFSESEMKIYHELNSAYNSKFYPGVLQNAEKLEENYPQSSFLINAICKKGESLFFMNEYEKSIETLEKILPQTDDFIDEKISVLFFLGQSYQKIGDFQKSIQYYAECANLSKAEKNYFYEKSIFNAGISYFSILDYKNAEINFEYIVSNFQNEDFYESFQKLCICYNSQEKYQKTINLFNQIKNSNLQDEIFFTICIYSADAYKELNQALQAYQIYCLAIESGIPEIAIIALKKAYILASENNIGVNPADVFSKTAATFENNSELVQEFWCRLGIDEFNKKNYEKSWEFFENVEKIESEKKLPIANLYKAKILIESKKDFFNAEKELEFFENNKIDDKFSVSDSCFSTLLSCKINLEKWNEIPKIYKKIKNPQISDKYNLASYYYKNQKYNEIILLLDEIVKNDKDLEFLSCAALYSSSLLKLGKLSDACRIYEKFYLNGKLNSQNKNEYAKALFLLKDYKKSYEVAKSSNSSEGNYICGINLINLKDFSAAKENFINYIKSENSEKDFYLRSYFYKGYCEYCLEDYKNAYLSFVRFSNEQKEDDYEFLKKSYEFAAKSALQYKNFDGAISQTEALIKISNQNSEKQENLLFLVDIYCDMKDFSSALEILSPYVSSSSDFKIKALFKTAQVYEKQNDFLNADVVYQKIYKEYPNTNFAEDAIFRSGEIFYSAQDYASSQKRFSEYIYKFTDGKYYESALFFCGDCNLKLGRFDESVMMNLTLLSNFPATNYEYSASENLVKAYESQEYFSKALEILQNLVKKYPEKTNSPEMKNELIKLEKIVSGTDKSLVEKLSDYENAGKSKTFEGRKIGSELVNLYAKKDSTIKEAEILALEILENHKEDSVEELEIAAENSEFLGNYYRKNQDDKKAGEFFLNAAKYFRSYKNDNSAATCLFSAAESFFSVGQFGDAKKTVELLQELYPNSKQAKVAARFL